MKSAAIIRLENISKTFRTPAGNFTALDRVDLEFFPGEFTAITGRSGSGKTTLLNLIAGIDKPTSGGVLVEDKEVHRLSESDSARWRGRNVGVVFQFFQLLPALTALENVMLPMDFCKYRPAEGRKNRALELLGMVGLKNFGNKYPAELSGGEQQRVAIARSLANDPSIIVADEPTGNLDSHTSDMVYDIFKSLSGMGKTVLLVSHDREISNHVARIISMSDGHVISDSIMNKN